MFLVSIIQLDMKQAFQLPSLLLPPEPRENPIFHIKTRSRARPGHIHIPSHPPHQFPAPKPRGKNSLSILEERTISTAPLLDTMFRSYVLCHFSLSQKRPVRVLVSPFHRGKKVFKSL